MSSIQKFFKAILPARWVASMEAESRSWLIRCGCGHEKSVWESGGIRWKASGSPRRYLLCQACGQLSWHTVHRKAPPLS